MNSKSLLVYFVCIFFYGCAYTSVRYDENLEATKEAVSTIALMPSEVSIVEVSADGENEELVERQMEVQAHITQRVNEIVSAKGYQVSLHTDTKEIADEHPGLNFQIEKVREKLKTLFADIYQTQVKEGENRINETVESTSASIGEVLGADALLFIDVNGYEKSGGKAALDFASSFLLAAVTGVVVSSPSSMFSATFSLIKADTGQVLWTNINGGGAENSVTLGLKKFPNKKGPLKVKKLSYQNQKVRESGKKKNSK